MTPVTLFHTPRLSIGARACYSLIVTFLQVLQKGIDPGPLSGFSAHFSHEPDD